MSGPCQARQARNAAVPEAACPAPAGSAAPAAGKVGVPGFRFYPRPGFTHVGEAFARTRLTGERGRLAGALPASATDGMLAGAFPET